MHMPFEKNNKKQKLHAAFHANSLKTNPQKMFTLLKRERSDLQCTFHPICPHRDSLLAQDSTHLTSDGLTRCEYIRQRNKTTSVFLNYTIWIKAEAEAVPFFLRHMLHV